MADQPIRVLDLVGSPAEVGRAHGSAYSAEIREYTDERVHLSSEGTWAGHAMNRDEVLALAEACLPAHEAYDPELYAEKLAMAEAAGLSPAEAVIVGGFTDFIEMAFAELGETERAWELLGMINPVNHARSPENINTYKVEPYVVAADVYAVSPHTGRGGWTWYTGSAGWMYRLIVESLLGLRLEHNRLRFVPCLPKEWATFKVHYRFRQTMYHITLRQSGTDQQTISVTVDGMQQADQTIPLVDDRRDHSAEVTLPIPLRRLGAPTFWKTAWTA